MSGSQWESAEDFDKTSDGILKMCEEFADLSVDDDEGEGEFVTLRGDTVYVQFSDADAELAGKIAKDLGHEHLDLGC